MRGVAALLLALAVAGALGVASWASEAVRPETPRRFSFRYAVEVPAIPEGAGPVHVFLPLPIESEHQRVVSREVRSR